MQGRIILVISPLPLGYCLLDCCTIFVCGRLYTTSFPGILGYIYILRPSSDIDKQCPYTLPTSHSSDNVAVNESATLTIFLAFLTRIYSSLRPHLKLQKSITEFLYLPYLVIYFELKSSVVRHLGCLTNLLQ